MAGRRTLAVAVSLVNAVWSILAGIFWRPIFQPPSCPGDGGVYIGICALPQYSDYVVLALGIVLLIGGLVCITGWSIAFYATAVLSVVVLAAESLSGVQLGWGILVSAALAIVTIVADVIAARTKSSVAEENHPLNLPVFG